MWDVMSGQHVDLNIDASACSDLYCEMKVPLAFPPYFEERIVEVDSKGRFNLLPAFGQRPFVSLGPFVVWDHQGQIGAYWTGIQTVYFPLAGGGASRPVVLENYLVYQRDLGPVGSGGQRQWQVESFDLGALPMAVLSSVTLQQSNPPRPAVYLDEVWHEGADSAFIERRWTHTLPNLMATYNFGGVCETYHHPTIGDGPKGEIFLAFQGLDCEDGESVLYVYDLDGATLYQAGLLWNPGGDRPSFSVRGRSIAFADVKGEMQFIDVALP